MILSISFLLPDDGVDLPLPRALGKIGAELERGGRLGHALLRVALLLRFLFLFVNDPVDRLAEAVQKPVHVDAEHLQHAHGDRIVVRKDGEQHIFAVDARARSVPVHGVLARFVEHVFGARREARDLQVLVQRTDERAAVFLFVHPRLHEKFVRPAFGNVQDAEQDMFAAHIGCCRIWRAASME